MPNQSKIEKYLGHLLENDANQSISNYYWFQS